MSVSWQYQRDEKVIGPLTQVELQERYRRGELGLDDPVRREELDWQPARNWPELGLMPPRLVSNGTLPTAQVVASTHPAEYLGYFLSRVIRSDFSTIAASEAERKELDRAKEPIKLGLAQDYVAWRRSVLTVAAILLAIQTLHGWSLPMASETLHGWSYFVYVCFKSMLLASHWIGLGCVIMAAISWCEFRTSVILARVAWLLMFIVPALLFMLPVELFMGVNFEKQWGIYIGMAGSCVQFLFPKAIGLFPGLIRSCLTLKSLVPESAGLGWIVMIVSPLYGLLLLVVFALSVHLAQTIITPLGLLLLAAAPWIYVANYKTLVRSHSEADGQRRIRQIRLLGACLTLAGMVLLVWKLEQIFEALFRIEDFRPYRPTVWQITQVVSGIFASILLLTVVAADFILAVMRRLHDQQQSFQGSQMQTAMVRKFTVLTNVGLSDWLGDDQSETISPLETSPSPNA